MYTNLEKSSEETETRAGESRSRSEVIHKRLLNAFHERLQSVERKLSSPQLLRAAWLVEDVLFNQVQLRPILLPPRYGDSLLANIQRNLLEPLISFTLILFLLLSFIEKPGWAQDDDMWEHYPLYFASYIYLDRTVVVPIEAGILAVLTFCFAIKLYLLRGQTFDSALPLVVRLPLYFEMFSLFGAIGRCIALATERQFFGLDIGIGYIFRLMLIVSTTPSLYNMWKIIFTLIPRIMNIMALLAVFMIFFSWSFWWIFTFAPGASDVYYFNDLDTSYFSTLQLINKANFPGIMMPFYSSNPPNGLLFIAFIVIGVFFLMNILVSLVYYNYQVLNEDLQQTYRSLHSSNIKSAFSILSNTGLVGVEEIILLIKQLDMFSRMGPVQCARVERILFRLKVKRIGEQENVTADAFITLEEFEALLMVLSSEFQNIGPQSPLEVYFPDVYKSEGIQKMVKFVRGDQYKKLLDNDAFSDSHSSHNFEGESSPSQFTQLVDLVVLLNLLVIIAAVNNDPTTGQAGYYRYIQDGFVYIYIVELLLTLLFYGPVYHWRHNRNRLDSILIILVFVSLNVDILNRYYLKLLSIPNIQNLRVVQSLICFRSIRLLRHLKMAPSFYNLLVSMDVALNSAWILLLMLFTYLYFSAVFGINAFGGCICKEMPLTNGTVFCAGDHGISATSQFVQNDLFHNNFNDLPSGLTVLFEVLIAGEVWDVADGIGIASGKPAEARAYFILNFVFGALILLNLVLAVIIESTVEVFSHRSNLHIPEPLFPDLDTTEEGKDDDRDPTQNFHISNSTSAFHSKKTVRAGTLALQLALDLDKNHDEAEAKLALSKSFQSITQANQNRTRAQSMH